MKVLAEMCSFWGLKGAPSSLLPSSGGSLHSLACGHATPVPASVVLSSALTVTVLPPSYKSPVITLVTWIIHSNLLTFKSAGE